MIDAITRSLPGGVNALPLPPTSPADFWAGTNRFTDLIWKVQNIFICRGIRSCSSTGKLQLLIIGAPETRFAFTIGSSLAVRTICAVSNFETLVREMQMV